jgi:hypothetical protein
MGTSASYREQVYTLHKGVGPLAQMIGVQEEGLAEITSGRAAA